MFFYFVKIELYSKVKGWKKYFKADKYISHFIWSEEWGEHVLLVSSRPPPPFVYVDNLRVFFRGFNTTLLDWLELRWVPLLSRLHYSRKLEIWLSATEMPQALWDRILALPLNEWLIDPLIY
jgi:hypothetical protein